MKKLEVRLTRAPENRRTIGWLAENERQMYFEYDPAFLQDPLWLSPFKLPPQPGLLQHRDRKFGPGFGLFDDSLPDGWGLLLMDRFFRQQGLTLSGISVLERLAYLGSRTMGALTYHPSSAPAYTIAKKLDLQEMANASRAEIAGTSKEVLPQLLRAGGSPGGARPKVLIGVRGEHIVSGEDDLPHGYEHWIVKFTAHEDLPDAGPIEFAYAQMAAEAGVAMPPTRLFETAQGERYFGAKRFDRYENHRCHVHTFANLIHVNFRVPGSDYRDLLQVTQVLTRNHQDVLQCFRRMVFNVLAHNRDDHAKNFAFRMNEEGEWGLAPAYDITFASGPGGEHSLTIADEGRAPTKQHLLQLAGPFGIGARDAEAVIDEVAFSVSRWRYHAKCAGVGSDSTGMVERAVCECLSRAKAGSIGTEGGPVDSGP